jgi:predicted methyltransferase
MRYNLFRVLAVGVLFVLIATPPTFAGGPDATVKITGKSVAAGVGISWGNGVLSYNGKEYAFSVTAISAGEIGVTSVELAGNVLNLKSLDDFSGNYTSLTAGATLAGGAGAVTMRNQNGVVMNLIAMTRGLSFDLGVDGVKVQLKK